MSPNTTDTAHGKASTDVVPSGHARRRRLILALTILAFLAIGSVALYAISLIVGAVVLLILSALYAYFIYPLVQFFQRRLPRPLAIAVAYLLVASALAVVMLIVASSLNPQLPSLVQFIQFLLSPAGERRIQSFIDLLGKLGITKEKIAQFKNQLFSQAQGALSELLPFLIGLFANIFNLIIVITLSVYFVLDGARIIRWLSLKTPVTQRSTINFLLHTLDQSLGGYFRGSLLIAFIGALGTGVGLALLHVPYAALLGALFFLLYFVPVIGGYVIGALCILAALPQGVGDDAHCGYFYDGSPGDCHRADTLPTHFQQGSWSSSHCGPFRALRWRRTLRIAWRVPRYTCCWRSPADHHGFLAQVGKWASRTVPARRVAASTISSVVRTAGCSDGNTHPRCKTLTLSW
jgi:predicted PurR-regulated permease PerM